MFDLRSFMKRRSNHLFALVILALDLIAPRGLPVYMLYAPLACREAFLHPSRTRHIVPAGLALLGLGLLFPPQAGIPWFEWAGRGMGILTVMIAVKAGSAAGRSRDRHKRTEERLSEIEAIYATAPVGLGLVDTDLRYVRVNERLATIHGRSAADHLGRSIRDVLPRPLSLKLEEIHRRVMQTGLSMRAVEVSGDDPTHPGTRRDWLASYEPVRDFENRVVGVSVVVHDVSRFAQAERLWRARASSLRALYRLSELEAGSAGVDEICKAALDGLIEGLEADRAGVLLRPPEGALVFRAARGFSGGLQARLARMFTRREQDGDVSTLVVHDIRRLPDSPLKHALRQEGVGALALMPLDHGQEVPGSLVVAWDKPRQLSDEVLDTARAIARHVATADERRRREEALMLSEQRFRWLSSSGILAIATFDMDGRILEANDAFLDMVRYSRADLTAGRLRWDRLTPPEWMDRTLAALREMSSTGRVSPYEKEYIRSDGTRLWGLFGGARIGDGHTGISFVIDITSRRETERRLEELTATLEERVVERTREAELRADRSRSMVLELAQAEDRERRRISQVLHDELQQYLVAARVQIRHLQARTGRTAADGPLRKVSLLLDESLEATRALTRDLTPPILRTSGLIAALKWLADWMHERHGLRVRIDADPDCDHVSEDAKMFSFQAVRELLLNVVKHAGVNEADIKLGPCKNFVRVEVIDKGAGFDPAKLDTAAGVSGLGLSGVRQRVDDLGGSIEVRSSPGAGASITFTIPLLAPDRSMETAPDGGMIRVLVADDHDLVRQGVVSLLSSDPGIEVVGEAVNGEEVVVRARALRPDVVVMDVRMPGLDGIEATRRIKRDLPQVKVVGLSQFADEEAGQSMRAAGAGLFYSKSDAPRKLIDGIHSLKESA